VTSFRPQARLLRQMARFEVVGAADGLSHVVLPTTAVVLGFQFLGRVQAEDQVLSPAGVTGLQEGPRTYSYLLPGGLLDRFWFIPESENFSNYNMLRLAQAGELGQHDVKCAATAVLNSPTRVRQATKRHRWMGFSGVGGSDRAAGGVMSEGDGPLGSTTGADRDRRSPR
jgi:hypothetical protein